MGVQIPHGKGQFWGERTCRPTCHPSRRQMSSSAACAVMALSPARNEWIRRHEGCDAAFRQITMTSCFITFQSLSSSLHLLRVMKFQPGEVASFQPLWNICLSLENWQELIRRWDSEHEHFNDYIVHVQASAYAHWTNFLISTINIFARSNLCT